MIGVGTTSAAPFDLIGGAATTYLSMNETSLKAYISEMYPDEDIIIADGFAEAFIGVAQQFRQFFAVYNRNHCIHLLMESNAWDEE